eukprot:TRINITY_DN9877_c0_g1_i1.p1 TRINITY_DN9877_c0_g1~~TRINITY_DN9877_c0_g1_i1.p1  ORF type:complete len:907 (+),score=300.63 TRINITY_DN9877_c0_g1_i1:203-2923(+)
MTVSAEKIQEILKAVVEDEDVCGYLGDSIALMLEDGAENARSDICDMLMEQVEAGEGAVEEVVSRILSAAGVEEREGADSGGGGEDKKTDGEEGAAELLDAPVSMLGDDGKAPSSSSSSAPGALSYVPSSELHSQEKGGKDKAEGSGCGGGGSGGSASAHAAPKATTGGPGTGKRKKKKLTKIEKKKLRKAEAQGRSLGAVQAKRKAAGGGSGSGGSSSEGEVETQGVEDAVQQEAARVRALRTRLIQTVDEEVDGMTLAEQAALLATAMPSHFGGGKRLAYRVQQTAVSHVHHSKTRNHSALLEDCEKRDRLAEALKEQKLQEGAAEATQYDTVHSTPSRFRNSYVGDGKSIHVTDLTMRYDNLTLLDGADLRWQPGRVYGMIGANGCGKSTLLQRIAAGAVQNFPAHLSVLHVQQENVGDVRTALQTVIDADEERRDLLKVEKILLKRAEEGVDNGDRLAQVYERLEEIGAYEAEARASSLLSELNFTEEMKLTQTTELSGGWRMRVALAQALFIMPDVLLLDEPTNHLDLHAVLWLQQYFNEMDKDNCVIVIVSHDRGFLDAVATDIILWKNKTFEYHAGNLSSYMQKREERIRMTLQQLDWQERRVQHLQKTIQKAKKANKKLGDRGNLGGVISSREKAIDRMIVQNHDPETTFKVGPAETDRVVRFSFPPMPELRYGGPLLQLSEVSYTYPGASKPTLSDLTLEITPGSRVAILGRNGSGKSTLMNLLRGVVEPTTGDVVRHHELRLGHFTQHHMDQLDLTVSALEHMRNLFASKVEGTLRDEELRAHLGSYGMQGSIVTQPMRRLSGGQRSRVVFAAVTFLHPHILLLDEPTNHLDHESIAGLGEAIKEFSGGVVLVSHDQYLIQSCCDDLWHVVNGRVKKLRSSFEEYREMVLRRVARA